MIVVSDWLVCLVAGKTECIVILVLIDFVVDNFVVWVDFMCQIMSLLCFVYLIHVETSA